MIQIVSLCQHRGIMCSEVSVHWQHGGDGDCTHGMARASLRREHRLKL